MWTWLACLSQLEGGRPLPSVGCVAWPTPLGAAYNRQSTRCFSLSTLDAGDCTMERIKLRTTCA